tara:strand:+ start:385 stop:1305 length:921 start_codon:yes stop_codon:yes gene_type:complete
MPVVEVNKLSKSYGDLRAVAEISFNVEEGEIFGMLGPNGAGKSTTVEIMEGVRQADSGLVRVAGLDPQKDRNSLRQIIGIQLQSSSLFPKLNVDEHLKAYGSFYTHTRKLDDVVDLVGLTERRRGRAGELSGGQQQRLAIALALINDPQIVFLDEPTTGLDPQARRRLWEIITELRNGGTTVILTTHYMEEAEALCDRLIVMDHGSIIESGTPSSLINKHFSESAIGFSLKDGALIDADAIQSSQYVTEIRNVGSTIEVFAANVPGAISDVLGLAGGGKETIEDIHVRKASLEDVFLKLTGRTIRD